MAFSIPDWTLNLVAGLIGGAVRAANRPELGWPQRIATSIAGGATATYLTPFMAPIVQAQVAQWGIEPQSVSGACGFVLGIIGLTVAEAMIKFVKRWMDSQGK